MWPAQLRALEAVCPESTDELRASGHTVALYCFAHGCAACAAFDAEARAQFERTRLRSVDAVLRWDCGDAACRALALHCGVRTLPAYVIVPAENQERVRVIHANA